MHLRPYGDRMIVEAETDQSTLIGGIKLDKEGKTAGGLFVAETLDREEPQIATIVGLGEGRKVKGTLSANAFEPYKLKVGDKIIINKYAGAKIEVDGKPYKVITSDDVLVVMEK